MSTTTTNPAPKSDLLDELRQILQEQHRDVAFVCGGSVPIVGEYTVAPVATEQNPTEATQKSQPVTIRWDSAGPEGTVTGAKVTLPLTADKGGLEQLLRDMQPATFGLLGETVLDETYRKASKMDTTQFCSTFNPYELGIIDAIAQVSFQSCFFFPFEPSLGVFYSQDVNLVLHLLCSPLCLLPRQDNPRWC